MRILFFAPVPNFKGGAEISLKDLLANSDIIPHLAVPAEGPLSEYARARDIPVALIDMAEVGTIRRPFRPSSVFAVVPNLVKAARQLNAAARQFEVDIVHSNGLKAHAIALVARWIGGKPVLVHIRDIANTAVERMVWQGMGRAADRTIIVSAACWPSPHVPANTTIIHDGFNAAPAPVTHGEKKPVTIGFVGRIHEWKGVHVLLDAVAALRREGLDVRTVIRGNFENPGGPYEQRIRKQVADLALSDSAVFDGFVADPAKIYEGFDIVCVPSFVPEPLGRSVIEAMGFGIPVVAARTGGIVSLIDHGRTGYLADAEADVVTYLRQLSVDVSLRSTIGLAGYQHCRDKLSVARHDAETTQVYRSLVPAAAA